MIWKFRSGALWREMPAAFGAWSSVHNRFRQWRDAGVFEALPESLIAEAAQRDRVDLSPVSLDSATGECAPCGVLVAAVLAEPPVAERAERVVQEDVARARRHLTPDARSWR